MVGLSFVAGIGFTVSLLVGELSYGPASETDVHVKVGVLLGSLTAATLGAPHPEHPQPALPNSINTDPTCDKADHAT